MGKIGYVSDPNDTPNDKRASFPDVSISILFGTLFSWILYGVLVWPNSYVLR